MRYFILFPIILLSLTATAQTDALRNAKPDGTVTPPPCRRHGYNGVTIGGSRGSGTIYIIDHGGIKIEDVRTVDVMDLPKPIPMKGDLNTPTSFKLSREDINRLPLTDITDMIALSPSVYQLQRGTETSFSGGRGGDILFVIDGMQIARR